MKFMVMECHPGYAVVLDEEGRFRKVANMRYEVGQTVTDVTGVEVPQAAPVKRKAQRWIGTFATAAACILMLLIPTALMPGKAHASVYVTINPEVRIDVDRRDTVVGLEGVNGDGKLLIEGYSYRRKDLDTVVDELVDRAIGMDFLHEGDRITLSLETEDPEWVTGHSDHLVTQLTEYLMDRISVTVEIGCDGHDDHYEADDNRDDVDDDRDDVDDDYDEADDDRDDVGDDRDEGHGEHHGGGHEDRPDTGDDDDLPETDDDDDEVPDVDDDEDDDLPDTDDEDDDGPDDEDDADEDDDGPDDDDDEDEGDDD